MQNISIKATDIAKVQSILDNNPKVCTRKSKSGSTFKIEVLDAEAFYNLFSGKDFISKASQKAVETLKPANTPAPAEKSTPKKKAAPKAKKEAAPKVPADERVGKAAKSMDGVEGKVAKVIFKRGKEFFLIETADGKKVQRRADKVGLEGAEPAYAAELAAKEAKKAEEAAAKAEAKAKAKAEKEAAKAAEKAKDEEDTTEE